MRDIEIIIPVLNEQDSIAELVKRIDASLKKVKAKYGIIFVDDNSTDHTARRIKSLQSKYPITYHKKQGKRGKAYSVLEGVKLSRAKILAMIDGDLQYPPEALPEMYSLMKTYGVVVANRKKDEISKLRKIGSDASSGLVGRVLLGLNCDAQSGLKVFKREIIEEIDQKDVKPWALDMPLLFNALEMGEKIGGVEIEFKKRENGQSKVKFVKTASEITLTALKLKFGRRKPKTIRPKRKSMLGAGVAHKRKKFITHTTLPHHQSALFTLSAWQKIFVLSILGIVIAGLAINYMATLVAMVAVLSVIYFADVLFSIFVLIKSLHFPPELAFDEAELKRLDKEDLPIYTILCPLYKEGNVLPEFIESIKNLDWPEEKLDVLILLEEDDHETLSTAKALKLPKFVRVLVVPDSQPRTKPKACNYGLLHSKGEYVVVYDAEDKPDPLQLKKAYLGFIKLGPKVFCLQSKLNYFNPDHNILTRLFTAEYSLWFDVILPGLQSIESSIPLGGTSNHFRKKDLIQLHAWDPFNVTEDCDLGVRIFKAGYKTAIIDSVTYEEANSSVKNWIRQRSRWIKGYMQTYLVHMREPIKFFRTHGLHAVIFQLIIGMRMTFMLINPFLWVMTIAYFAFRSTIGVAIEALYPSPVFYMAAFALVTGNFMYIYNYMIGCAKRGHWGLVKFVFLIPAYWILASIAAFKATHQLIVKPHFWEKTHHGLHLPKVGKQKDKKKDDTPDNKQEEEEIITTVAPAPAFSFSKRIQWITKSGISSGILLIAASMVSNVLNFVTSAYLGRELKPEDFGLIALMSSFLFLTRLPSSGVGQTLSHQTAYLFGKFKVPYGTIWKSYKDRMFKISLVFVALWILAIPLLNNFFNSHTLIPFFVFAPMWTLLLLDSVHSGYLQGSHRFQLLAALLVIEAFAKLFVSVLFVVLDHSEWVYAALPLSLAASLIFSWYFAKRVAEKYRPSKQKEKEINLNLKFPFKFFWSSVISKASSVTFLSLDLVFVKHFLTSVESGHYALLVLVGRMVYMIGGLSSQFIMPLVSKEEGSGKHNSKTFLKLLLVMIFTTTSVFVVVGPLGTITVPLLFGEKALPIIPYLTPFAFSMILFSVSYSLVTYHQAKREYIFAIPGVLTAIVLFASFYFFHSNISEVVAGMLFSSVFFLVISLVFHIFESRVRVFFSNLQDLFDLFYFKLNGKKPLADGFLRILIFNWRDAKHVWAGGAEVYVHELAKRWVQEGHKVTLFCGNDGRSRRNEDIDGVKIIRRGGFYTVYLWAALYYLFRFRKRYDVVVESENGVPFFTPLYSTKPKVLVVHHVHQEVFRNHLSFPLSFIARLVESKLMPFVYRGKTIVAVSESTKKEIAKTGISSEEDIYIVSPGVDTNHFKGGRKTAYPSVIYVGRHKAYKNIDIAIKAFYQVLEKYPRARFVIAGEGEKTDSLKALAKELGIEKSVDFVGKVTEEEKIKLLSQSWMSVQPSSFEGWGITVIEANACKTPVIASKVNGLRDSIVENKTGILVPVKSSEQLSEAIIDLIKNTNKREKLSKEAFKWAQTHDWDNKAIAFMRVIQSISKKKGEGAFVGGIAGAGISYDKE